MNRLDFLHTLYQKTENLPETVRREVLENYKEHYRISLEKGETEEQIAARLGDPAQIADRIRKDPRTARATHKAATTNTSARLEGSQFDTSAGQQAQYPPHEQIKDAQRNSNYSGPTYHNVYAYAQPFQAPRGNSLLKGLAVMTLLFFMNLIFVLGPWLAVAGVVIGLWGAAIGMTIGGIAGAAAFLLGPIIPWIGTFSGGLSIATALAGCAVVASLGVLLTTLALVISKWFFKLTGHYAGWNIQMIIGRKIA